MAELPFYFFLLSFPLMTRWGTIFGTLFEGLCVCLFLEVKWYRALAGVVVANIISTFFGAVLFFALGTQWPHIDRFLLIHEWIALLLVSVIYTAIELPILVVFGVRWEWRSPLVICGAKLSALGQQNGRNSW
jgi:hypothetical protein